MTATPSPAGAAKLIRMANQIAAFFATQPGGHACADVAEHLRLYWPPSMREQLAACARNGADLSPVVRGALALLGPSPKVAEFDPGQGATTAAGPSFAHRRSDAMTYQSILVHAEADPKCEPRLQLAAGLANRFDATLIGAAAELFEPDSFAETFADTNGQLLIAEAKAVDEDLKIAARRFTEAARTVNAGSQWRAAAAMPSEFVAEQARAADLLIVGPRRRDPFGFHNRLDPGDLLMRAGRPVLIAPPELAALDASSVLVAWKDAREARRAVRDALPFLQRAHQVLVAEVADRDSLDAAEVRVADVAEYLGRHGIKASTAVREHKSVSASDTLIRMAEMQDADLIVAGAFGHSRMREWAFGGVTRELLWYGQKAILLSH